MFHEQILSGKFSPSLCHLDIEQAKVTLGYEKDKFNVGADCGVGTGLLVD